MTPEDADKAQQWAGMDGAIAWHLIDRHADDWNEVGELMNAWLRANGGGPWIACADKLPQQYVTCIVGRTDVAYPVTAFWTGEKWCRDVKDDGMHVTHWRPMPEGPSNAEVTGLSAAGREGPR
jgi:hypothetical protein